jgi:protein Tex
VADRVYADSVNAAFSALNSDLMSATLSLDTSHIARDLQLRFEQVDATLALLDAGNTVPFITRYRKDQTGGLDELQIRQIQQRADSLRMLNERKQTILRSIDSQGKLTPELAAEIEAAQSTKRLDDLYLPFKPKKQTLATTARERGLELLAEEILSGAMSGAELDARAADFANPDKGVPTAAEALLGAGHIIAEQFSEHADLRARLRKIMRKSGRLVSKKIETESKEEKKPFEMETPAVDAAVASEPEPSVPEPSAPASDAASDLTPTANAIENLPAEPEASNTDTDTDVAASAEIAEDAAASGDVVADADSSSETASATESAETVTDAPPPPTDAPAAEVAPPPPAPRPAAKKAPKKKPAKTKKDEKHERLLKALSDYFDFQEDIKRIPAHRVLAINRGERAKVLRVRVDADVASMEQAADELMIQKEHPNADLLRGCLRDALNRLVLPSLEREIRRELTDNAEEHAVDVFARNLRHLLLQPPIHNYRVLAIDPGFRSGCKLAALDEFGGLLDHGIMHIVGKDKDATLAQAKAKMAEVVRQHNLSVVAIGNGTACRETERLVAELIGELKSADNYDLAYVIVNEAGASVYSTSSLGRDEFPQYDATLRGAISIGRRLLDPLSELVKIEPANIGVGLYQHDVKAKHLRESLDAVVESCVNFVGVDLNTASPALLRYVSGLNQLTAQRVYEHRTQNGPFKSREQLMEVAGFGEATFVQAAGFLKIGGGENPLDATWIHPESYDSARSVLEKVGGSVAELASKESVAELAEKTSAVNVNELSTELGVGNHLLRDIIAQLVRPGRDPREELPKPVFKHGVLKMEDLTPGMELSGTVLNVVDFGAFVDIGLHDSGLVHVSQMANRFIRDPHEVVAVGDVVKVWVATIDKDRRRVGLSMLAPGTEREHPPRGRQGQDRQGQNRQGGQARPAGQGQGRRDGQGGQAQTEGAPATGAGTVQTGGGQGNRGGGGRFDRQGGGRQGGGGQGGGGRRGGGGGGGGGGNQRRFNQPHQQPRPKPKPVVPLTKAMEEGKEPLRTFGDLMQFYQKKKDDPADDVKE